MDPAYISALSALAGATIGGLTSFATSWSTQLAQLRHGHREAEKAKLYSDFITEASRLFGDALTHQTDAITNLVQLYAMVGRMRLVSAREVVVAATRVEDTIIQTYQGPNRSLHEILDLAHQGKLLVEFGEACRKDLATHATKVR